MVGKNRLLLDVCAVGKEQSRTFFIDKARHKAMTKHIVFQGSTLNDMPLLSGLSTAIQGFLYLRVGISFFLPTQFSSQQTTTTVQNCSR